MPLINQDYPNCHTCNFCLIVRDPSAIGKKIGECHGRPPVTSISMRQGAVDIQTVFPVVGNDPRSICSLHQNFNVIDFKSLTK